MKHIQTNHRSLGAALPMVTGVLSGVLGGALVLLASHVLPLSSERDPDAVDAAPGTLPQSAEARSPDDAYLTSVPMEAGVTDALLELREGLESATEERAQLAATLVSLNRQTSDLEERLASLYSQGSVAEADSGQGAVSDPSADEFDLPDEQSSLLADERPGRVERQYENLLAAGLDEQSARNFQSRTDQFQLSRLELFDQAAREGWEDSGQLTERLQALNDDQPDLREELGDSAYDRYLYAAGSANRVSIDSVITGSAAELSGLQVGDQITSYAGDRVFQVQDLQQATRAGSRGESVQLVFEREGQTLSSDILRGPLGVTLRPTRQQP